MYTEVAEYTKTGNFGNFIRGNITLGQKASLLWAVNAGRFFQTAGLFLLGFYLGRKQLFIATEKNSALGKDIDNCSNIFCSFIFTERMDYAK